MFTEASFEVFDIDGLEPRMAAIREEIQPVFRELGAEFLSVLIEIMPDRSFHQHIAQHLRRRTNAPDATLTAFAENKRGYKMLPHFQIGINRDFVFVFLGIIDDPKYREVWADELSQLTDLKKLPQNFVVSKDHMNADVFALTELDDAIFRLKTIKKADFELGRIWPRADFDGKQDDEILSEMLATLRQLTEIYLQLTTEFPE